MGFPIGKVKVQMDLSMSLPLPKSIIGPHVRLNDSVTDFSIKPFAFDLNNGFVSI